MAAGSINLSNVVLECCDIAYVIQQGDTLSNFLPESGVTLSWSCNNNGSILNPPPSTAYLAFQGSIDADASNLVTAAKPPGGPDGLLVLQIAFSNATVTVTGQQPVSIASTMIQMVVPLCAAPCASPPSAIAEAYSSLNAVSGFPSYTIATIGIDFTNNQIPQSMNPAPAGLSEQQWQTFCMALSGYFRSNPATWPVPLLYLPVAFGENSRWPATIPTGWGFMAIAPQSPADTNGALVVGFATKVAGSSQPTLNLTADFSGAQFFSSPMPVSDMSAFALVSQNLVLQAVQNILSAAEIAQLLSCYLSVASGQNGLVWSFAQDTHASLSYGQGSQQTVGKASNVSKPSSATFTFDGYRDFIQITGSAQTQTDALVSFVPASGGTSTDFFQNLQISCSYTISATSQGGNQIGRTWTMPSTTFAWTANYPLQQEQNFGLYLFAAPSSNTYALGMTNESQTGTFWQGGNPDYAGLSGGPSSFVTTGGAQLTSQFGRYSVANGLTNQGSLAAFTLPALNLTHGMPWINTFSTMIVTVTQNVTARRRAANTN